MVYQLKRLQNNKRPQAFWGALIPSAINFVGGLITSSQQAKAQKRALEEQKRLAQQQLDISNQNQLASTLNNYALAQQSYDDKDYNLKYRIGGVKRLGGRNIMITDGGNAKRIGNNTYLLRGGSHEDINETGQTGIGINVGGNEIEAEGGEVAQRKGNSLRIYSAQPILGGISPAEAIMRGYNKDKVFNAQQRFKKNNGIKDDGSKAQWGMGAGTNRALQKSTKNGTRSIRSMWNSAKIPLSYTPIIGTAIDGYDVVTNPSWTNAANFGVSLASDLLGYKFLKGVFSTPIKRTVNLTRRGRVPSKVAAGAYSGASKGLDTEMNYLQNKKSFGGRTKARIGTETDGNENKTNILTSNLNAAEYLSKIISGAIMQGGRLLTGNSKDRGPVNNVAQDTYLMPFRLGQGRAFKDAGYDRDYQSEKKRDYGLVQKAVGNENIPIYSRVNNPEKRKELIQIYNPESTYMPNIKYPLIHAANHPSSLYIDGTNGNIMYKGWDLNDYGTSKGGKGFSNSYGSIRKTLVNTLDAVGNPTVVTTGYQNVLDNDGKPMNIFKGNYKDDFNANMAASDFIVKQLMKKDNPSFINEYGMSPVPDIVITAPRKRHRLGGGLTSKDRGSSKHPYPSVASKDFAGGNRSYPIPTKADAIDALRLAGLHGRSDVRSKVYSKYPELRKKAGFGDFVKGTWNFLKQPRTMIDNMVALAIANQIYNPYSATNKKKGKYGGGKSFSGAGAGGTWTNVKPATRKFNNFNDAYDDAVNRGATTFKFGNKLYNTKAEGNPIREINNRAVGSYRDTTMVNDRGKEYGVDFGPIKGPATMIPLVYDTHDRRKHNLGGRPKAEKGMLAPIYSYRTDKRRLPSFAPIDVTPRAIPNFKPVSATNAKTPFNPNSVPFLGRQSSFKPATQDYIGLGIDTLAALGSGMFTRSAYNKMNFDYALPNYVDESPVAFDTTYHNEAQRANIERNRLNSRNLISGNTSSAQTALGRMQQTDTDAMMETNKLLDEKSNKEVELRNQNLTNEQQVRARNAAARNQYYQSVAQIKNAALEAKNNMELARAQSIGADLSGLSQAWSNFAGSVEQRYNTRQNEAIIAATSKNPAVLSNAVQFGYNFSPEVLAAIYNSTDDDNLKSLALSQLSTKNRLRYGIR